MPSSFNNNNNNNNNKNDEREEGRNENKNRARIIEQDEEEAREEHDDGVDDDDVEEDENEDEALIPGNRSRRARQLSSSTTEQQQHALSSCCFCCRSCFLPSLPMISLTLVFFACLGYLLLTSSSSSSTTMNWLSHNQHAGADADGDVDAGTLLFTCPTAVQKSLNDKGDAFDYYVDDDNNNNNNKHTNINNISLEEIRHSTDLDYDGWGISYPEIKQLLQPWKVEAFTPNLKGGDVIYESACGKGLNLLITLDVLRSHEIYPITVHGSDYMAQSVKVAKHIMDLAASSQETSTSTTTTTTATTTAAAAAAAAQPLVHRGNFCPGDSTNLSFVPSSSFDLVYTGYIDPVMDILNELPSLTSSSSLARKRHSIKNCNKNHKTAMLEQSKQEDWWNEWVSEMIRIAKPGKVIIVENNALPICDNHEDWGGVAKEWWTKSATLQKYGWDVDPESIVIRDMKTSSKWNMKRYHVMMRKNE